MILILNPTQACNMACRYCYNKESDMKTLSLVTFEIIVKKFIDHYDYIEYSWHGGEPLLMGRNYFKKIVEIQNCFYRGNPNKKYINTIQTSGLLLNSTWYDFFTSMDFHITVSYDGIDSDRVFPNNNSTYEIVSKNIVELKNEKNYSPRIVCVLSSTNINYPHKIYFHFKHLKIPSFSVLPYFGKDESLKIYSQQYYNFHKSLFEIWRNDKDDIIKNILPLSQILNSLLQLNSERMCSWNGNCFEELHSIETQGDIYLCNGLFENEHKIGNILKDELCDIYKSKNYIQANQQQQEAFTECKECNVSSICNCGCRISSFYSTGSLNHKDPLCHGRKKLIEYISKSIL